MCLSETGKCAGWADSQCLWWTAWRLRSFPPSAAAENPISPGHLALLPLCDGPLGPPGLQAIRHKSLGTQTGETERDALNFRFGERRFSYVTGDILVTNCGGWAWLRTVI